jgi:uncharacterized protein (TIGR02246 family)
MINERARRSDSSKTRRPIAGMRLAFSIAVAAACFGPTIAVRAEPADRSADRAAIAEVVAQYAYRWDGKDAERFADLFTANAVFARSAFGEIVSGSVYEGRDMILQYAKTAHAGRLADRQSRHHMSSLVFLELQDTEALTQNIVLVTHQTAADPRPSVQISGVYRMAWRKTDRGWRIASRILAVDRAPG